MNGDIDVKKVLKWVGIIALVAIPVVMLLRDRDGRGDGQAEGSGPDDRDVLEFD
jgi:hypothetical protein